LYYFCTLPSKREAKAYTGPQIVRGLKRLGNTGLAHFKRHVISSEETFPKNFWPTSTLLQEFILESRLKIEVEII